MRRYEFLTKILNNWPGRQLFGIYRFLPLFFCLGAILEYSMIKWDVNGKVNFYRTYKNRRIQERVEEIMHQNKGPIS